MKKSDTSYSSFFTNSQDLRKRLESFSRKVYNTLNPNNNLELQDVCLHQFLLDEGQYFEYVDLNRKMVISKDLPYYITHQYECVRGTLYERYLIVHKYTCLFCKEEIYTDESFENDKVVLTVDDDEKDKYLNLYQELKDQGYTSDEIILIIKTELINKQANFVRRKKQ